MVSVTASTFTTLMNITLDASKAEAVIDQAIDRLNSYLSRYNIVLPNMSGTAGSKTVTLTEKERGAVMRAAGLIYANMYVSSMGTSGSESYSFGPLSKSSSSSESASTGGIEGSIEEIAKSLKELEVDTG